MKREAIRMTVFVLAVFTITIFTNLELSDAVEDHGMSHSMKNEWIVKYSTDIKPLFESRCVACHGSGSPEHREFKKDKKGYISRQKGPRMDSYTHMLYFIGWPDTGRDDEKA